MSTPIDARAIPMDGSWIRVLIDNKWTSVIIKMRETDVVFQSRGADGKDEAEGTYVTFAIGSSLILTSDDFTTNDFVEFKAASGTLEMLGFLRK